MPSLSNIPVNFWSEHEKIALLSSIFFVMQSTNTWCHWPHCFQMGWTMLNSDLEPPEVSLANYISAGKLLFYGRQSHIVWLPHGTNNSRRGLFTYSDKYCCAREPIVWATGDRRGLNTGVCGMHSWSSCCACTLQLTRIMSHGYFKWWVPQADSAMCRHLPQIQVQIGFTDFPAKFHVMLKNDVMECIFIWVLKC